MKSSMAIKMTFFIVGIGLVSCMGIVLGRYWQRQDGLRGCKSESARSESDADSLSAEDEMRMIIDDYIKEVVKEAKGVRIIFTDGALDDAIRREAERQGMTLHTLSMMSGNTPREVELRKRAAVDREDEDALTGAASDALRLWALYKPERMKDVAIQLGFELWTKNPGLKDKPMPVCSGVLARTHGISDEDRQRGVMVAHQLADRILKLYDGDLVASVQDKELKKKFLFVQWRLARMCQMRANASDKAGRTDEAMADTELADKLDAKNEVFQRLRQQMDGVIMQKNTRFTWRESLDLSLRKADFRLARTYAQRVLEANPDDSAANFAMGMSYFVEEQYGRAEEYLRRSLAQRPDEPAALNNLAVVLLRQERYAEAETNALHALRVLPAASRYSSEVKKTVDAIRKKAKTATTPR